MKSKHLHLQFKFVDRGGREVYEIFAEADAKRLSKPLGTIRMENNITPHIRNAWVEWDDEETEGTQFGECHPEQLELPLSIPKQGDNEDD